LSSANIRPADPLGRGSAPRAPPVLGMEKDENAAVGATLRNGFNTSASRQNPDPAKMTAGSSWFCPRDIINLKQGVDWRRIIQAAPRGADVTIRSKPRCQPNRQTDSGFRLSFTLADARGIETDTRSDRSTTCPAYSHNQHATARWPADALLHARAGCANFDPNS
jgi:hypothetical protein